MTEGEYSYISRTVVFPSINSALRTDAHFRAQLYGRHHKGSTPLIDVPNLDLIQDIVVGDRLHLIDLGVMKRLLHGWRDGTLGFHTKMSLLEITSMSKMMLDTELPSEIHRKMRGLDCLTHWKGSEFSSFLHYAGIVILKKYLTDDAYNHFLLLFSSITMLSSNEYRCNWHVARSMLQEFISQYTTTYGPQFITSNIHNLQHIVDECEKFGPLNSLSAYPFENALFQMKQLLRNGSKTLQQVANRLSEIHYYENFNELKLNEFPKIHLYRNNLRLFVNDVFFLSNNFRDCWFFTIDKGIVRFETAKYTSSKIVIQGHILNNQYDYFQYPISSSAINVFEADITHTQEKQFSISQIFCKMSAIKSTQHTYVFIPLLHTII